MRVHITKIYGFIGTGGKAQEAVTTIAKRDLGFEELGLYHYPVETDTPEMLGSRLDGILASVSVGDIVIVQSPTWNDLSFDEQLMNRLNVYWGPSGKIIWVHDILPLFLDSYRASLKRYIDFYNRADVLILPTRRMEAFLRENGLTVKKVVIHKMFDYEVPVDQSFKPPFRKVMNLAGNPNQDPKLKFCKEWDQDNVQLAVTVDRGEWGERRNVRFLGWFHNDFLLLNALRKSGGFGLLWVDGWDWKEYIKMNASYKFSTYLAAGIPVVVPSGIGEEDTIRRKKLGLVVDSLDEAAERIERMSEAEYREMADNVERFSYLLREGYFTKKALTDAVFQLLND